MSEQEFWDHISLTRRKDPEDHAEYLADRLAELPVDEILAFGKIWMDYQTQAYSRELWGAAYLINGGASDDGFQYFRDWLILQGQPIYQAALQNPDSLADVVDGMTECEVEFGPAYEAYTMVSEQEDYTEAMSKHFPELPELPKLSARWDFDDEKLLRQNYPRLAEIYLADFGSSAS